MSDVKEPKRDISAFFELTYAQWLTLPRVLLEDMPIEWQEKFVALLDEFDNKYDWIPDDAQFYVSMRRRGKIMSLPEYLCNYRHPDSEIIKKIVRPHRGEKPTKGNVK